MKKHKVKSNKIRVYETIFCQDCQFLDKECSMLKKDSRPFDENLKHLFLDVPVLAEKYKVFKEPKIKNLAELPEISEKYLFVFTNPCKEFEETVIVPMSMVSKSSKSKPKNLHSSFNAKKIGAVLSAKAPFLLPFIEEDNISGKVEWVKRLKDKGVDFVFAPNISFYSNQPSCSVVYNRFVTYKTLKELNDYGMPAIPSMLYLWDKDLKNYCNWIAKTGYKAVYLNMQLTQAKKNYFFAIESIKKIMDYLPKDTFIYLLGVHSPDRIAEIEKLNGNFKYFSSRLSIASQNRFLWDKGKEVKLPLFEGMYYDDVMVKNIKSYREFFKEK